MIEVLQRQHVQKRAAMPVRMKTHLAPAHRGIFGRLRGREHARWGHAGPRWENKAIPARFVFARAKQHGSERVAPRRAERAGLRLSVRALPKPARVGLLTLAILVLLGTALAIVVAFAGIRIASAPSDKPLLPSPPETDQDIYRMLVPEEAPHTAGAANAVLSSTLKVAQYKAQAGESISQIAQKFRLNLDTLLSWNDIHDAHAVRPGTTLGIPNADGLKYTVRRGDTLDQIARANSLSLNTIVDWNRLPSSVISVGQELFLPGIHMRTNELNRILGNLFIYPVHGKISSYFGLRPDPFTGVRRFHNGVDIVNAPGTPIMAAMAGTVEDVGFNNNYGYYVILRHSGYQTLYGHLSRYGVARGEKVQQGEKIGELGTTGYSTGPHLHFSIFRNGEAVDPLAFLK